MYFCTKSVVQLLSGTIELPPDKTSPVSELGFKLPQAFVGEAEVYAHLIVKVASTELPPFYLGSHISCPRRR